MSTSTENNSNEKDFLSIENLKGDINGVNSPLGKVNDYIRKGELI